MVLKLLLYPPKLFITYLTGNLINMLNLILAPILFLAITVKWNILARLPETLKKHLYEHKCDIRLGNSINALFQHISKTNHNFNFNAATMLTHIHYKRLRQIFEVSDILLLSSINSHPNFFHLSSFFGKLVLNSYNISNFN